MRRSTSHSLLATVFLLSLVAACPVQADVVFELLDVPQGGVTVGQAVPFSETQPHPAMGAPVLIRGRLTNIGTDTFEAIGPSCVGAGQQSHGVVVWVEMHNTWWSPAWDPDSDADDPYFYTDRGYPAFRLQPGESFEFSAIDVWGMTGPMGQGWVGYPHSYGSGFASAPVGNVSTVRAPSVAFWEGLDSDPNNGTDPPEITRLAAPDFTVTVVPEPTSLCVILAGLLACCRTRVGKVF